MPHQPETPTKNSNPIVSPEKRHDYSLQQKSVRLQRRINERLAEKRELKSSNTWRTRVALYVKSAIHDFWSSTILSHATRFTPLANSSETDTHGTPNSCEMKFGNAVFFASYATDYILSSRWSTIAMTTSKPPCETSMPSTISITEDRTNYLMERLEDGTLDFNTVTMAEWLQISFLVSFHSGEPMHLSEEIMYGGNLFSLHACVEQIVPNQPMAPLRKYKI